MTGYILKRLLAAIPVILGITVIAFLIMSLIPGDPALAILGSFANARERRAAEPQPRARPDPRRAVLSSGSATCSRAISGGPIP